MTMGVSRSHGHTFFGSAFWVTMLLVDPESSKVLQWNFPLSLSLTLPATVMVVSIVVRSVHQEALQVIDTAVIVSGTINMEEIIKGLRCITWSATMIVCLLLVPPAVIVILLLTQFIVIEVMIAISRAVIASRVAGVSGRTVSSIVIIPLAI